MKTLIPMLLAVAMAGCIDRSEAAEPRAVNPKADPRADPRVKRGAALVSIGGCNDCHTPKRMDQELQMPVPDLTRMLSGHQEGSPDPVADPAESDMAVINGPLTAFKFPFGIVYTANLTPDKATGIGGWDEKRFLSAMRTGRHLGAKNGRPILPPMPWYELGQQSDEDLRAIFAYLKSIPAIRNQVPAPTVPTEVLEQMAKSYDKLLGRPLPPAASR